MTRSSARRHDEAVASAGVYPPAHLDPEAIQLPGRDDPPAFSWRKLMRHTGPGFLMCIAFVDPGNLEADLQTGAGTGYQLLWVLLWSTACGFLLQSLACRLGVATGRHLSQHCRARYPTAVRYSLYLIAEMAVIGSDVQEVIGTALALALLTQGALPLWGGVVLAAVAAYMLLLLEKCGVRWLEASFQVMVGVMSVAMGALFFRAEVAYAEVGKGLVLPRMSGPMLPTAAGLLGAILMPHNLYLHSALVHSRAVDADSESAGTSSSSEGEEAAPGGDPLESAAAAACPTTKRESILYYNIESALALFFTLFINVAVISVFAAGFFGHGAGKKIGLENAGIFLGKRFGRHMQVIWAVGLLAAGQSSTMTGTYAGQFVMSGFLNIKVNPFARALLTRAVAIVPALGVALSARSGRTQLDVLNQVINVLQAVQLPFAVIPLLVLTSDRHVMGSAFYNTLLTAATCWIIAGGIIAINAGTAYQTAVQHLPPSQYVHAAFWAAVALYFVFVVWLVAEPWLHAGPQKQHDAGPGSFREPLLPLALSAGEHADPSPGALRSFPVSSPSDSP